MAILPFDLIEYILSFLPVKSLKRFRCVEKSWCYRIDSKNFIKLHLRRNFNHHLILDFDGIYSVDLGPLNEARKIEVPFPYDPEDALTDSCNGVILVISNREVLWNPFLRSHRVLPDSSMVFPAGSGFYACLSYGFGYDSITEDYKVLKVRKYQSYATLSTIMQTGIYSLKSNSWKKIENFPYPLDFDVHNSPASLNGSIHTLVHTDGSNHAVRIMAFSFETEKHYEVMTPNIVKTGDVVDLSLRAVGGSLCFIQRHPTSLVIWVMKEYGVKESWSVLLKTKMPPPKGQYDFESLKPLVYSRDGNKVLLDWDGTSLFLYDLRNKNVQDVHVDGIPEVFLARDCVESLVSLEEVHILPFDLIEYILSFLPVKSLKRFRRVQKSWRSKIDSENFIKLHLCRNFNHHLILDSDNIYSIDLGHLNEARVIKAPPP